MSFYYLSSDRSGVRGWGKRPAATWFLSEPGFLLQLLPILRSFMYWRFVNRGYILTLSDRKSPKDREKSLLVRCLLCYQSVANVHGKSLLMGNGQAGYKEHISEELSVQPGISPHLCYVRHTSCHFRKSFTFYICFIAGISTCSMCIILFNTYIKIIMQVVLFLKYKRGNWSTEKLGN